MIRERLVPSSATDGFFQEYPHIGPQYTSPSSSQRQSLASNSNSPNAQPQPQPPSGSDDAVLDNILRLYLPPSRTNQGEIIPVPAAVDQSIHDFAQTCLDPETLRLTVDCETDHPRLQLLTTFGERNDVDPLRTSEGWRGLKSIQTRAGIVAWGYRDASSGSGTDGEAGSDVGYNRRVHQFALAHLWSPSSASVSCPAAMSDGAAVLLRRHMDRTIGGRQAGGNASGAAGAGQDAAALQKVIHEAYARLVSFDPAFAWTSGQWMTERPGGSNVSDTETLAHLLSREEVDADIKTNGGFDTDAVGMALGPYVVNGFKWFSSATDADMVVLLAKTRNGLSAFYAPMRRGKKTSSGQMLSVMNGVRISRLKNKLGTKGLPTAELEIKGMRAWLLGEEGKGVKEISAILNLTRLWTGCGSVGYWSRGLAVARAYAKVRRIKGGSLLCESKSHLRWMASETVKYRACAHLAFLGVALLGLNELGWEKALRGTRAEKWLPKESRQSEMLLRLLTPVIKAQCSTWTVWGLRECMESLGGVGYCETNEGDGVMNLARLCRDAMVNPMWEGTTTILSEDFVRVTKGRDGSQALAAFNSMVRSMLEAANVSFQREVHVVRMQWTSLYEWLSKTETEKLLYEGREALQRMQDVICAGLLLCDALHAESDVEAVIARRWISARFQNAQSNEKVITQENESDRCIFLGRQYNNSRDHREVKL